MDIQLIFNSAAIAFLCRKHHIINLKLFGSALTDAFNEDSDIDLLATFAPGQTPGWEIVDIERAFAELLGRPVDLLTEASLRPRWRGEVLPTAEVLYAA